MLFFHLGAFGTIMLLRKLDAKRAKLVQLMQKFVPRCLVRSFDNERSRSTPLESKLMFWCVSFHLGAFGTVSLVHQTCCKMRLTGAINTKVRTMMSCQKFCNERSRSTPWTLNSCFGAFLSVRVHFGPFRYCTKLGAKRAKLVQLMQKFVP